MFNIVLSNIKNISDVQLTANDFEVYKTNIVGDYTIIPFTAEFPLMPCEVSFSKLEIKATSIDPNVETSYDLSFNYEIGKPSYISKMYHFFDRKLYHTEGNLGYNSYSKYVSLRNHEIE